ncbi:mitochondrial carrier [Fragilariopsis cylindrus CCMP1102]|uniref:Mitochondrial carrier n=1 Tax=Fragilariopsis cylindrus CCMP1102 TaxID=635003 RepID=A0A1E7EVX6_9STRA|nr:mitochondrial carrier [Fragilariopsis cylindrus CCMP1102]|eukprot:OEU09974.1 mitochondrial carrier [Fragilariopsis cylindrus CCMP1102]
MKPHLKHISSPSESLSSSLEQASSSSSFMRKRRSQSSSIATNAKTTQMTSATSSSTNNEDENTTTPRGGSTAAAATTTAATAMRPLYFWESMVSGAVSRSIAQTVMHPANTMKTMMQSTVGPSRLTLRDLIKPQMFRRLSVGAGANFILSLPHGAFNFAVLEAVRAQMSSLVESNPKLERNKEKMGPGLDFISSAIATICCSVVSTPQMMITDNIMAGNYPNLISASSGLYTDRGVMGFYTGWWPGLVGKIPSYALTWTFFQQLKRVRNIMSDRPAKNYENTIMGCVASAACVCIMIPMDTIKTRLVTQVAMKGNIPYKGIIDCGLRVAREEGINTFYRGLTPRLMSVVPMIGIQFGVYEAMKREVTKMM